MFNRCLFIFLSLFISLSCNAQVLEINLGEETAQLRFATNAGGSNFGRSELTYGLTHNNETDFDMFEIGLLVIDIAGSKAPGLEVGIGPKLYFVTVECCDAAAVGLGGTLRYKLGTASRFFLAAKAFYAPSVVSFGDADSMHEVVIELGFEVLPNANIYVGKRDIDVSYAGFSSVKADDTAYFGMRLSF